MKQKQTFATRVKHKLVSWLGAGVGFEQEAGPFGRSLSDTGVTVSPQKALSLSSVWACTRLVSQTISTLPIGVYEKNADGTRKLADDLQVARLIHTRPNADMTAVIFWEAMIGQALLLGNAFAEKKMIGNRLVALEFMSADRMSWRRLVNGEYEYLFVGNDNKLRTLTESQVFHLPGFTLWGKFGMSVIKYGAQVFGAGISANQAANATFKNGLMPTTYFKYPKVLRDNQREDARNTIKTLSGAMNAGNPVILEAEMDVGAIGINPDDAQLLESRVYSAEEICRWFGVPPSMIGITDKASSWASSSEQLNLWFLQYGLRPWLKRIEQSIWMHLFSDAEKNRYYAEYSVEGLLRADTAARQSLYTSALQNGWMNRNEVRRFENMPPIDGGDVFTVQSNLIGLDKLEDMEDNDPASNAENALKTWLGMVNEASKRND